MSKNVKNFLNSLATDANALKAYAEDPDKALKNAGLEDAEKDAIKSGDRNRIMGLMGGPATNAGIELVVTVNVKISL